MRKNGSYRKNKLFCLLAVAALPFAQPYSYFKLRDFGAACGFTVDWTKETGIIINTWGPTANQILPLIKRRAKLGHADSISKSKLHDPVCFLFIRASFSIPHHFVDKSRKRAYSINNLTHQAEGNNGLHARKKESEATGVWRNQA